MIRQTSATTLKLSASSTMPCTTILRAAARPLLYFPNEGGRLYVVRANGSPADLTGTLRREIQNIDAKLVVTVIAPIKDDVERALRARDCWLGWRAFWARSPSHLAAVGLYAASLHPHKLRRTVESVSSAVHAILKRASSCHNVP